MTLRNVAGDRVGQQDSREVWTAGTRFRRRVEWKQ